MCLSGQFYFLINFAIQNFEISIFITGVFFKLFEGEREHEWGEGQRATPKQVWALVSTGLNEA